MVAFGGTPVGGEEVGWQRRDRRSCESCLRARQSVVLAFADALLEWGCCLSVAWDMARRTRLWLATLAAPACENLAVKRSDWANLFVARTHTNTETVRF